MLMRNLMAMVALSAAFFMTAMAAEPVKTVMVEPGKSLLNDDLSKIAASWKAGKGKWEVVDGALRGAELKDDMHGAVTRHDVAFQNGVIAFAFKLDGAKQISLSMNATKGHVGRVIIRPNGFSVNKDDQDGKKGDDKPVVLKMVETPIKPGVWHTMVLEVNGKELLATLDGEHVAYGEHDALEKPKANIGLTVAGEKASFKNLTVSEGSTSKDWATIREKYKK
jgi:hypothetical protein